MNKTLGLLIALIFCISNVFAQTQKGEFLLGAGTSLDFSFISSQSSTANYSSDKVKTNSFEFTSRIGYFLANNFVTGIDLMTTHATSKADGNVVEANSFVIGPFVRYYFGQSYIKPFIDAGFGLGRSKSNYDESNVQYSDDILKSKLSAFDAGGGISFVLTPKVTIEVGISYGDAISKYKTYYNEDAKTKVTGVGSYVGLSIHL